MLYSLRLSIDYEFHRPTGAGRQLLRILPRAIAGVQRVIDTAIAIVPTPVERNSFADFFGTTVVEVVMPAGLTGLTIEMNARVERLSVGGTMDLSPPRRAIEGDLAAHASLGPDSPQHFLGPSPRIPAIPAIGDFSRAAVRGAATLREAIAMLGAALHRSMTFDADATEVDTPIAVAFAGRHGVCQDFSQIMICGLRSLGIPAAYVSGYLRTLPPPGRPRLSGGDAMHAWVRAWAGSETGWIEYDPTNACFVDLDHIVVGYGRDYADAAPVTGMLRLDGSQTGSHRVDIVAA